MCIENILDCHISSPLQFCLSGNKKIYIISHPPSQMSEPALFFVLLLACFLFFSLSLSLFFFGMDMSFYFLIFLFLLDIYSHYPGADRLLSFPIQSLKTVLWHLQTLFLPSPPIPSPVTLKEHHF